MSSSIFVKLPEKAEATTCSYYRTLTSMSHAYIEDTTEGESRTKQTTHCIWDQWNPSGIVAVKCTREGLLQSQNIILFSLCFLLCGVEAGLLVTPKYGYTFVICFHWSLLLACSLHSSSSSAFLISLFTQPSHLSCGLPRFLKPSCFFVSDIFGILSSFILIMCPAHFIRLLTMLPTIQALVPTSSRRSFILRLSNLLTPAILLVQLFSHTCSLYLCSSDRANVSKP